MAECFELRDESSLVGVAGAASIEVVGTEIGVDLTGREHVPDDDKNRVAGRDGSFGWSSSSTDAVIVRSKVRVLRPGSSVCGFDQGDA